MTKKLLPALALVVALAATPSIVSAQKKADQKLSLAAQPAAVTITKELKLTGQLTGGTAREVSGQRISLQSDPFPYEGKFERVPVTVETDNTGRYSFTIKPLTNARYQTSAKGGVDSPVVEVPVRVLVKRAVSDRTPESGARVKFSGSVAPAHDGKVAQIQRRTSSGWKNVSKVTLVDGGDAVSKYSKRVRITKSGRYRVRFDPADGDHAAGNSSKVRITVG
jgi:hypothetical protein